MEEKKFLDPEGLDHLISKVAPKGHKHSYNDLSDKPTIPSAYTHPSTHPASMITGLAEVATSGSYNDLSDKPTIPTIPSSLPANGGNATTVGGKSASDFAGAEHEHTPDDIDGTIPVTKGGTGVATLASGQALIGAGNGAVTTRAIKNNLYNTDAITGSQELVNMNTLRYALNRTTGPGTADANYGTLMMRAIKAGMNDVTAGSTALISGAIHLVYE